MKRILCVVIVICMLFVLSACTENSEGTQNRNQELVGCWVTKSSDGLIGGIQFFSDGTYFEKYLTSESNWNINDGSFCAEFDGTFKRDSSWIFDYKLENNKLIISDSEETQEFTKWDKNISHIEEYTEN